MGAKAETRVRQWAPKFEPMPSSWTMGYIRAAIPSRLFERKTSASFYYLARDVLLAVGTWRFVSSIELLCNILREKYPGCGAAIILVEVSGWIL